MKSTCVELEKVKWVKGHAHEKAMGSTNMAANLGIIKVGCGGYD